jgi:hypothetical protein
VRLDPLADQPLVLLGLVVMVLEELVQLRVVGRLGCSLGHLQRHLLRACASFR